MNICFSNVSFLVSNNNFCDLVVVLVIVFDNFENFVDSYCCFVVNLVDLRMKFCEVLVNDFIFDLNFEFSDFDFVDSVFHFVENVFIFSFTESSDVVCDDFYYIFIF